MKLHYRHLMLLLGLLSASTGLATASESTYQPLRPISECLDPARARAFNMVDSSHVLLDAGRRHFLIELSWACPALSNSARLEFRASNPSGRICGDIGESVSIAGSAARGLDRCKIARITRLNADEYSAELRALHGSIRSQQELSQ